MTPDTTPDTGNRTCLCGARVYRTLGGQVCEKDSYKLHRCEARDSLTYQGTQECNTCYAVVELHSAGSLSWKTDQGTGVAHACQLNKALAGAVLGLETPVTVQPTRDELENEQPEIPWSAL